MKHALALILSILMLPMVSCTSAIVKRIEHNPQIYTALSESHKALVSRGEIIEGMSKPAVFLAWGRPNRGSKGSKNGKSFEHWSYTGYEAVPSTNIGFGMNYWGDGCGYYAPSFYYEPTVTYLPFEIRFVEFINNKVTAWSTKG